MEIFYQEKLIAPSEKFSCYAPASLSSLFCTDLHVWSIPNIFGKLECNFIYW